jgi:transposase
MYTMSSPATSSPATSSPATSSPATSSTVAPAVHIGLDVSKDVSKDSLDVCMLSADKRHEKQFANDAGGHRQLVRWAHTLAKAGACHFCIEATGPYSQAVALFLIDKAQKVSVINPARIRFFGLAQNQGNKTDKADARLIAEYCRMQNPPQWRIAEAEVRLLQEMVRRLHALSELATQEKNRIAAPGQGKAVLASNKRIVQQAHRGGAGKRDAAPQARSSCSPQVT